MTPPGNRVLSWARACFGEDVAGRVFDPLIADWQQEWLECPNALGRGRSWCAGWGTLLVTGVLTGAAMAAPWRADRAIRGRSAAVLAAFSAAGIAVLLAPFLRYLDEPTHGAVLLVYLLPSSLGLTLSFALLPVSMRCANLAPPSSLARARLFVIGTAAACVIAALTLVAWLAPLANQAWRESIAGAGVPRGIRELTLPELWRLDGDLAHGITAQAATQELRRQLGTVFAWPTALAILGWRLGRHRSAAGVGAMTFWWAVAALGLAALDPTRHIAREAPWLLAPLVWLLAACALSSRQRSAGGGGVRQPATSSSA